MDLDPLFTADAPIPAHAILAIAATALGGLQFATPKGTVLHRGLGYAWVAAMVGVAVTALFIYKIRLIGPFSPIHLLIPVTFYELWAAIRAARRGDVATHRRIMIQLYVFALLIAGAFTFMPGRVLYEVFFGG